MGKRSRVLSSELLSECYSVTQRPTNTPRRSHPPHLEKPQASFIPGPGNGEPPFTNPCYGSINGEVGNENYLSIEAATIKQEFEEAPPTISSSIEQAFLISHTNLFGTAATFAGE
jgi:hypothetical protein